MNASNRKNAARTADWINLIMGVALFVSPWVLGYAGDGNGAWNACIFGVVVAVLAAYALGNFEPWNEWVGAAAGVWILISPWILEFTAVSAAFWMHLLAGAVVAVLAGWRAWSTHHDTGTGTPAHA